MAPIGRAKPNWLIDCAEELGVSTRRSARSCQLDVTECHIAAWPDLDE